MTQVKDDRSTDVKDVSNNERVDGEPRHITTVDGRNLGTALLKALNLE